MFNILKAKLNSFKEFIKKSNKFIIGYFSIFPKIKKDNFYIVNLKKIKNMPQLDLFCFFVQIFWIIITFIPFYLMVKKFLLPQIAFTKKMRKKLFSYSDFLANKKESTKSLYSTIFKNID